MSAKELSPLLFCLKFLATKLKQTANNHSINFYNETELVWDLKRLEWRSMLWIGQMVFTSYYVSEQDTEHIRFGVCVGISYYMGEKKNTEHCSSTSIPTFPHHYRIIQVGIDSVKSVVPPLTQRIISSEIKSGSSGFYSSESLKTSKDKTCTTSLFLPERSVPKCLE